MGGRGIAGFVLGYSLLFSGAAYSGETSREYIDPQIKISSFEDTKVLDELFLPEWYVEVKDKNRMYKIDARFDIPIPLFEGDLEFKIGKEDLVVKNPGLGRNKPSKPFLNLRYRFH